MGGGHVKRVSGTHVGEGVGGVIANNASVGGNPVDAVVGERATEAILDKENDGVVREWVEEGVNEGFGVNEEGMEDFGGFEEVCEEAERFFFADVTGSVGADGEVFLDDAGAWTGGGELLSGRDARPCGHDAMGVERGAVSVREDSIRVGMEGGVDNFGVKSLDAGDVDGVILSGGDEIEADGGGDAGGGGEGVERSSDDGGRDPVV